MPVSFTLFGAGTAILLCIVGAVNIVKWMFSDRKHTSH
jgi:hypothetical protein